MEERLYNMESVYMYVCDTGYIITTVCCLQVNNAGIAAPMERQLSRDGFELTMATNYYGHFLLTNLLLSQY